MTLHNEMVDAEPCEEQRQREPHEAAANDQDRNFLVAQKPTTTIDDLVWYAFVRGFPSCEAPMLRPVICLPGSDRSSSPRLLLDRRRLYGRKTLNVVRELTAVSPLR